MGDVQRFDIRHATIALLLVVLYALAACGRGEEAASDVEQPMSPAVGRLLQQADRALTQHLFSHATAFVDSAAVLAPDLADVSFMRGRIHAELADLEKADSAYRKALAIRPNYPGGWHNLGNTAFRQQKYSKAILYYQREFEAHPDPRPWRGIGRAYVELGKTDSARYAFERALSIDSTFALGHFSLALLLEDLGDYDGALRAIRNALAQDPNNTEFRYYMGAYLVQLGRPTEAISVLEPVAEEWPWHHGVHYNIGQALMRLGRTDEAQAVQERSENLRELQAKISQYENTVRVHPNDPYAHAGLATLLRRAGRYNDAMHAYRVALYLDPDNLDIRHNVGVLDLLRKDTTAAVESFEQIVRFDSTNVNAWINLGSLYAMSGEMDDARAAWKTALRIDPTNEIAQKSLAKPLSSY